MIMAVGNDEFCIKCMEWREYDERGRCKICMNLIHKSKKNKIAIETSSDHDIESSYDSENNNLEDYDNIEE